MSGQLIELIIFAAIAFFIINKLISILGSTSENDPTKRKSFFGEMGELKDVSNTGKKTIVLTPKFNNKRKINNKLKDLIVKEHQEEITEGLMEVTSKLPSFNVNNFLKGARAAFKMIINAANSGKDDEMEELIDKRYIEQFRNVAINYGSFSQGKSAKLTAQISEIYMFGNNVFVKVLFIGKNITNKLKGLNEEWTFTKSTLSSNPNWYLTNIDKAQ
ncbi:MAG: Tim44/TimA family putative adaptor protein [Rickettsiaceae bacterium]|nr:Tim44/TimA family putative adaptor protein [Rickettsiaceae bacterium]